MNLFNKNRVTLKYGNIVDLERHAFRMIKKGWRPVKPPYIAWDNQWTVKFKKPDDTSIWASRTHP